MKKIHKILFFCFLWPIVSNSQSITSTTNQLADFVPNGWKKILEVKGDLNKDKLEDVVLVIEKTDSSNFKRSSSWGSDTLNLNPRRLLVLFKKDNGYYSLIANNNNGFVPSQNDAVSACLEDPLMADGGIIIEKGVLKIHYKYWLSCGSWFVNTADYTFRYQRGGMELIGFDHNEFHRASGESNSTSINFSTKKIQEITGMNEFEETENKPKEKWRSIQNPRIYNLQRCNDQTYFDLLKL